MQDSLGGVVFLFIGLIILYLKNKERKSDGKKRQLNTTPQKIIYIHDDIELHENFVSAYKSLLGIDANRSLYPELIERRCYELTKASIIMKKQIQGEVCFFHDPDFELAKLYLIDFYQYSCSYN